MKAQELRIGNLVRYNNKDLVVRLISNWEFSKNEIQDDISLTECEPIPLTEEWLLKFGFEKFHVKNAFGQEYYYKGVSIFFINNEFRYYLHTNRHWVAYEFVHEIQNLYFAFGEELTIK